MILWLNVYEDGFMDFVGHFSRESAENSSASCLRRGRLKTVYRIKLERKPVKQ